VKGSAWRRSAAALASFVLVVLVVAEPAGVFCHFIHEHAAAHRHHAGSHGVLGAGGDTSPDLDDHWHTLMPPGHLLDTSLISAPQTTVDQLPPEVTGQPLTAPFLPYSPPRA
jgi:hypothetical protein